MGTLVVETKPLHGIKRVPQCRVREGTVYNKYISHHAGTSTKKVSIILIGVPDYSINSEVIEKIYIDRVHCYYFAEGCL